MSKIKMRLLAFMIATSFVLTGIAPAMEVQASGFGVATELVQDEEVRETEVNSTEDFSEEASDEGISEEEESSEGYAEETTEEETTEEEAIEEETTGEETVEETTESETTEEATEGETTEEETTEEETTTEEPETLDVSISAKAEITEDIVITDTTKDTSGPNWKWNAKNKTFTMNGYTSKYKLTLPAGATIVLAEGSVNTIDGITRNVNGIVGRGALTIKGNGTLNMTYSGYSAINAYAFTLDTTNIEVSHPRGDVTSKPFDVTSTIIKASNLKIEHNYLSDLLISNAVSGVKLAVGTKSGNHYHGVKNTQTDLYELIFEREGLYYASQPEKINTIHVGESVTLKALAKTSLGKTIKYQWYETDDYEEPQKDATKVSGATKNSLKVSGKERGIKYYYCVATCDSLESVTDVCAVLTAAKGANVCTANISYSADKSENHMETEGWKWNYITQTLTLNNVDLLVPFSNVDPKVQVRCGNKVVLEGDNYIDYDGAYFSLTNASQSGDTITFTGGGTLRTANLSTHFLSPESTIKVTDNVHIDFESLIIDNSSFVIDNASVNVAGDCECTTTLDLVNDAVLEAGNRLSVNEDMTLQSGCKAMIAGNIEARGNVTINSGAVVSAGNVFSMNYNSDAYNRERIMTVDGTLHITGNADSYPFTIYSINPTQDENFKPVQGTSQVVIPDGATLVGAAVNGNSNTYAYSLNREFIYNSLLIAEDGFTTTPITKIGAIKGEAKYGEVLTAGAVTPSGAAITYQWQYADSKTGEWKDIYNAKGSTYEVETRYADKYLRVVAKGFGLYEGTLYSAPIGPVVGDPATLVGIYGIGRNEEEVTLGAIPFDGYDFEETNYSDVTDEGTYRYIAVPVKEDAKIVIRNKTTGFAQEGRVADVLMEIGVWNEVEIEVRYGDVTNTYCIDHLVTAETYSLELENYYNSPYTSLTATWVGADGLEKSMTTSPYSASSNKGYVKAESIPRGTKITVTSTTPSGTRAYGYNGVSSGNSLSVEVDRSKDGAPGTFAIEGNTAIRLYESDVAALAPAILKADWAVKQENAHIQVTALAKPDTNPEKYYSVNLQILDEEGNEVYTGVIDASENVPTMDGMFVFVAENLDSGKEYTIQAYYPELFKEYIPSLDEMQIAKYRLGKRREVYIKPKTDYIVLKPGREVSVPIEYNGYMGSEVVVEDGFDTTVLSEAGTEITYDLDGKPVLNIKAASDCREGTAYITLRGDDCNNDYVYATVRVDVSDNDTTPQLNLGVTSGSLNVYQDTYVDVPVYRMNCGHAIDDAKFVIKGAEFTESSLNEKLSIRVLNDRTLRIAPKLPEDSDTIDWAKWVKESGIKGTFSSNIRVDYYDTYSMVSDEEFTMKLTAKAPTVKAAAVKLNGFYKNDEKEIRFTSQNGAVTNVKVDSVKTQGDTLACPEWVTLSEDGKNVILNNSKLPKEKSKGNLYVKVWLDGWRIPAQIKVALSTVYNTPKMKFSPATITLAADKLYFENPEISLLSADKKVAYEDLGVKSIRVIPDMQYVLLDAKNRKTYEASKAYAVNSSNVSEGKLSLMCKSVPMAGKVLFYVEVANGVKPVEMVLNVKTANAPTLKLNKSTVTLYSVSGTSYGDDEQEVTLIPSTTVYNISTSKTQYKVTLNGDKSGTDYSSHLDIMASGNKSIVISRNENTVAGNTYKVAITPEGFSKAATLTVKVVDSIPTVKLSNNSGKLNRAKGVAIDSRTVNVTSSTTVAYSVTSETIEIIRPDGSVGNNKDVQIVCSGSGKDTVLTFKPGENAINGTYKLNIRARFAGGTLTKPMVYSLKMDDVLPTLKADVKKVTLNKELADYDTASVTLTRKDGYYYESGYGFAIKDSKGNDATGKLDCQYVGDTIYLKVNSSTEYGATYKVTVLKELAYGLEKTVTITAQIAKQDADISITGVAQGNIDVTRAQTAVANINYTFTNWNEGYYYGMSDAPVLTWKVYVTEGNNPISTERGAIGADGLVAEGNSTSADAKSGSWFKNSAYSDEAPYKLALMIDKASAAWMDDEINPTYKYTLKTTLTFPHTGEEYVAKDIKLKVKKGKTKFSQSSSAITLAKLDPEGRKLFTIMSNDKDKQNVEKIAKVELVIDNKVAVSNAIEILPVYYGKGVTYAFYWKDRTASEVANGKVKLKVYLEGNNPDWQSPNATISVKVNVK